jgi:hypothetical protein
MRGPRTEIIQIYSAVAYLFSSLPPYYYSVWLSSFLARSECPLRLDFAAVVFCVYVPTIPISPKFHFI